MDKITDAQGGYCKNLYSSQDTAIKNKRAERAKDDSSVAQACADVKAAVSNDMSKMEDAAARMQKAVDALNAAASKAGKEYNSALADFNKAKADMLSQRQKNSANACHQNLEQFPGVPAYPNSCTGDQGKP